MKPAGVVGNTIRCTNPHLVIRLIVLQLPYNNKSIICAMIG